MDDARGVHREPLLEFVEDWGNIARGVIDDTGDAPGPLNDPVCVVTAMEEGKAVDEVGEYVDKVHIRHTSSSNPRRPSHVRAPIDPRACPAHACLPCAVRGVGECAVRLDGGLGGDAQDLRLAHAALRLVPRLGLRIDRHVHDHDLRKAVCGLHAQAREDDRRPGKGRRG